MTKRKEINNKVVEEEYLLTSLIEEYGSYSYESTFNNTGFVLFTDNEDVINSWESNQTFDGLIVEVVLGKIVKARYDAEVLLEEVKFDPSKKINEQEKIKEHLMYEDIIALYGNATLDYTYEMTSGRFGLMVYAKGCNSPEEFEEKLQAHIPVDVLEISFSSSKAILATFTEGYLLQQ